MDFFKVSKDDIDKVKNNRGIQFKHGEEFTMLIEEIKEVTETGKEKLIISGTITSGEHSGRKHSIFVFKNSMSFFIDLLMCYYSEEEIMSGKASPEDLVGRSFSSTISISTHNGREYTNYRRVSAVSSVPELGGTSSSVSETIAKQVESSADVF